MLPTLAARTRRAWQNGSAYWTARRWTGDAEARRGGVSGPCCASGCVGVDVWGAGAAVFPGGGSSLLGSRCGSSVLLLVLGDGFSVPAVLLVELLLLFGFTVMEAASVANGAPPPPHPFPPSSSTLM